MLDDARDTLLLQHMPAGAASNELGAEAGIRVLLGGLAAGGACDLRGAGQQGWVMGALIPYGLLMQAGRSLRGGCPPAAATRAGTRMRPAAWAESTRGWLLREAHHVALEVRVAVVIEDAATQAGDCREGGTTVATGVSR